MEKRLKHLILLPVLVIFLFIGLGAKVQAELTMDGAKPFQRVYFEKTFKLSKHLAEQGDPFAQFSLGIMYSDGQGVPQDYSEALRWYLKSAEQGFAKAQFNVGIMYHHGRGVSQDHAEAFKWYRKAANQNLAEAQFNLGGMYESGLGVTQDYVEAVKWYRKAADQGIATAQYNLATMYIRGMGIHQDPVLAYMWTSLAASRGDPRAVEMKKILKRNLGPWSKKEGKKLARKWNREYKERNK